jgi:hypothetical protein
MQQQVDGGLEVRRKSLGIVEEAQDDGPTTVVYFAGLSLHTQPATDRRETVKCLCLVNRSNKTALPCQSS